MPEMHLSSKRSMLLLAWIAISARALQAQSQEISATPVGVVNYPGIDSAKLSPDGKKVAYRVDSHLRIVDLQTHQIKELASNMGSFARFHFSSDGLAIVYVKPNQPVPDTWNHYWRLPIAGGPETVVDITSNGPALPVKRNRLGEEYIRATAQTQYFLIDPATKQRTNLALADERPHAMQLGPADAELFIYWKDGTHHLLRLNELTGEHREIAPGKGEFISWEWAPDEGLYVIAVVRSRRAFETGDISRYPVQGGAAQKITSGNHFDSIVGRTRDGAIVALRYISTAGFFSPMLAAVGFPTPSGLQRSAEFVVLKPAKP
jgi:hypothetical protein